MLLELSEGDELLPVILFEEVKVVCVECPSQLLPHAFRNSLKLRLELPTSTSSAVASRLRGENLRLLVQFTDPDLPPLTQSFIEVLVALDEILDEPGFIFKLDELRLVDRRQQRLQANFLLDLRHS